MPEIESLPDFKWKETTPVKFRPFKPIYYITMGIRAFRPARQSMPWLTQLQLCNLMNRRI